MCYDRSKERNDTVETHLSNISLEHDRHDNTVTIQLQVTEIDDAGDYVDSNFFDYSEAEVSPRARKLMRELATLLHEKVDKEEFPSIFKKKKGGKKTIAKRVVDNMKKKLKIVPKKKR